MAAATSSFPVPVAPSISTGSRVGATVAMSARRRRMGAESPTRTTSLIDTVTIRWRSWSHLVGARAQWGRQTLRIFIGADHAWREKNEKLGLCGAARLPAEESSNERNARQQRNSRRLNVALLVGQATENDGLPVLGEKIR